MTNGILVKFNRLVIFIKKWRMVSTTIVCGLVWMPAFFIGRELGPDWCLPLFMFWAGMAYKSFLGWVAR